MDAHPMDPDPMLDGDQVALEEALEQARARSIVRLIDRAHAELPSTELAAVLLAIRRAAGPAGPYAGRRLSPQGARTLQQVRRLLPGGSQPAPWLEPYLDEVASRPRGAALAA